MCEESLLRPGAANFSGEPERETLAHSSQTTPLSLPNGVPARSLSYDELVETVRSGARSFCQLLDGSDECHNVAFSSQCESCQRVLQGRMSVAATELECARRGENHFVLLANVATIEKV